MARINTIDGLTSYIKSQLGAPAINIEVSNSQIAQIIDDTVQKFTEYAYGTLEASSVVQINGMGDYNMPDTMTNVIKVSKGSTSNLSNFDASFGGYVPNIWSDQFFSSSLTGDIVPTIITISSNKAMLEKFFGDDIVYNFNHNRKVLQVLQDYNGAAVIHYQYEYIAQDEDLVYNHEWVKAYAKAKVKELWGTVTGKFDQTLVGGARINYDRLLQEAREDIILLDEQLLTRWSDPAPIDIA